MERGVDSLSPRGVPTTATGEAIMDLAALLLCGCCVAHFYVRYFYAASGRYRTSIIVRDEYGFIMEFFPRINPHKPQQKKRKITKPIKLIKTTLCKNKQ